MRDILNFVRSLGKTSIEVYEWKEADIRRQRLPNSPDFGKLTKQQPDLAFNGWGLAHAIVKADYLNRRNLTMPGLGFLLQADNLIDFRTSPIQLKVGASKALNDFSLTSLAGRVGQGLAILYGHHLGLNFNAHLSSHVQSLSAGSPGAMHKGEKMADFLFSNCSKTVLIESKGSFTLEKNCPTKIKSVLKDALTKQVDPWMGYLQPTPHNGYVVYSCLREGSWAPSALSIVDPNGDDGKAADVPFRSEQVIRENYGAWLRAMGLSQAAERLTRQYGTAVEEEFDAQPVKTEFLVYEHGGREFAVVAEPYNWYPFHFYDRPAVGIDLAVLKAIASAIKTSGLALAEQLADLPAQLSAPQESCSIFPDGSVFGLPNARRWRYHTVRL
ncbi:hypothetical protein [Microvirgula aerodenitrificans]|uniref:hypothetical protein n=1 Tax=Microvirgula aerodenitrificans TaxID=57480 RepID=UPI0012EBF17D|nr:hypothetical protein [Microvirgula aerodenitrificans]